MNIINMGKILEPKEFIKYIDAAEKMDIVYHTYGQLTEIPEYPCWMQYSNKEGVIGSISFSRNTYKHEVLYEMVEKILKIFIHIFPDDILPVKERVHLIKTQGSVAMHRDEAGRNSCINVGIKNSSGAITRIGNDGIFDNFVTNNTEHVIKEGTAYLMNVNQWHEVEATNTDSRYLITYGFGEKFDTLKNILRY